MATSSGRILTFVLLTASASFAFGQAPAALATPATYVGSAACLGCHSGIYDRWKKTRMANVVRDPKADPGAILPDLSKPDPLVKFTKNDIAFVYGSKWKQRYFTKIGDDYFPLDAQWDITHQQWRAYMVGANTDWWVPFFPADNKQRPTSQLCDGCHSVNFNIQTKAVTEWNVGCEKCHGPGSLHVRQPSQTTIVNPARLDTVQATNVCIQCHSQGEPITGQIDGRQINGKYYDWPVGFQVGLDLKNFWKLEEYKLGEQTFTHFADGTAHKNRMQGNDFVQSQMYTHGVTCSSCHDVHGTSNNADLRKPANTVCLGCHGPSSPNGPHAPTIEAHTHHAKGSAGDDCVGCHMPKIEQQLADTNVRSHTFKFIPPSSTDLLKVPNACNACHTDKTTKWATDELKTWSNVSPWRVAN
ncbi:MAG: cytochrome c3 family protein [Acidobacteriota bacterium]